jgi:Aspartyl/Asparaginyl beta-hydroxylase
MNGTVPDRLRLPLQFDAAALARDLETALRCEWTGHFHKEDYEGDWDVLPLRAPKGVLHPILQIASHPGVTDYADTALLNSCTCFRTVTDAFACPLKSVRLMRLKPNSVIKEHSDPGLSFEDGDVRIHIPITTNPDVDFRVNRIRVDMEPGSAWYLRFADPHSVVNRGSHDRVHLVIDALRDGWMEKLFARACGI